MPSESSVNVRSDGQRQHHGIRRRNSHPPCKCERHVPAHREPVGGKKMITLGDKFLRSAMGPESLKTAGRERDQEHGAGEHRRDRKHDPQCRVALDAEP